MQRQISFKVRQKGIRKWLETTSIIDVPDGWDSMSSDNQREYLISPTGNHMHPGQILNYSSRFQLATGIYDDVLDFEFVTMPLDKANGADG